MNNLQPTEPEERIPPVHTGDVVPLTIAKVGRTGSDVIGHVGRFVVIVKDTGSEYVGRTVRVEITAVRDTYAFASMEGHT